jgi:hypothetical protein
MTDPSPRLARLGDDLERAARRDLRPRRRHSRRVALAVVTALIAVPAAAVAGIELVSEDDVARSIPAGTLWLQGTEPSCTVVKQDVEYLCTLGKAPGDEIADWNGAAMPTVDASKHVNGGCRSLNSDGTEWRCYVGEEAVKQQIIGPDFLGEYAPAPSVG